MAVEPTLNPRFHRQSLWKYLYESMGPDGDQYHLVDDPNIDYEVMVQSGHLSWVTMEIGASEIQPKMPVAMLLTMCSRADLPTSLDLMLGSARYWFEPGTKIPLYDMVTRQKIGAFMVDRFLEGPRLNRPGGGQDITCTILMRVGVVC